MATPVNMGAWMLLRVRANRPELRRVEAYLKAAYSEANGVQFPVSKLRLKGKGAQLAIVVRAVAIR
jgi:hypothetical protein